MQSRTFDIILVKTVAELKAEAKRTYLGVVWWIAEPLIFMSIFYFIFGVLFERAVEHFVPFLLIGLTLWQWFNSTTSQCNDAIRSNLAILNQVRIQAYVFPLIIVFTNAVKFCIVLMLLLTFLVMYGFNAEFGWLNLIPILLVFLLLTASAGIVLAALVPLFPDLRILVDNFFRGLFFLSGIFYEIESLPAEYAQWLELNPLATLIACSRDILIYSKPLDLMVLVYPLTLSFLFLSLGLLIVRRMDGQYTKSIY